MTQLFSLKVKQKSLKGTKAKNTPPEEEDDLLLLLLLRKVDDDDDDMRQKPVRRNGRRRRRKRRRRAPFFAFVFFVVLSLLSSCATLFLVHATTSSSSSSSSSSSETTTTKESNDDTDDDDGNKKESGDGSSSSNDIIVEDLTTPREGEVRSTHKMFENDGFVVDSLKEDPTMDGETHLDDLLEIGRSMDDFVDDGGPGVPKHYVCNACQASARKLDADLSEEEFKRARGPKYGKKLEEMFYLDAIEKSCDDHAHWHLYDAHVYDSGYHYLAGPLLGNASKRGSKPFVRDFSKHRWPKRLRDYCQILVNEFDEEGVYEKHYELQEEKLLWEKEKKKEEEEELAIEETLTEEEVKRRRRKKRRQEILYPHRKRRKKRSFDLAKKLCYQSKPPKCTFDNEFSKKAFLQLATHEEEEMSKEEQSLSWAERAELGLERGGIRYSKPETASSSTRKKDGGEKKTTTATTQHKEVAKKKRRPPPSKKKRQKKRGGGENNDVNDVNDVIILNDVNDDTNPDTNTHTHTHNKEEL